MDDVFDPLAIDVATAEAVPVLQGLFEAAEPPDGFLDDRYLSTVRTQCPSALVRAQAAILLAERAQDGGRPAEAERLYREGLRGAWDSDTRAEGNGLVNYALLCLWRRRPLEALMLTGRCESMAERRGVPYALSLALLYRAMALMMLGDTERLQQTVERIDASLEPLDEAQREYVLRASAANRLYAALDAGDAREARTAFDEMCTIGLGIPEWGAALFAARMNHVEGEHVDALRDLHRAQNGMPDDEYTCSFVAELVRVEALVGAGDSESAVAAGDALVERLLGEGRRVLGAGQRMRFAMDVCEAVAGLPGGAETATKAVDVAGAAALERIWETDGFRRHFPAFAQLTDEEREIIAEYRTRFVAAHGRLLDSLVNWLDPQTPWDIAKLDLGDDAPRLICVCAWCKRLRGPDAIWLEVGHYEPPEDYVSVTHGACEDCRDATLATISDALPV